MHVNFNVNGTVTIDGVRIANCTPHEIRFQNNAGEIITVPPTGFTLRATPIETVVSQTTDYTLVKTEFQSSDSALAELEYMDTYYPEYLLVGSIISMQAFGGLVVGLVPITGFERLPPSEKRYCANKFNVKE